MKEKSTAASMPSAHTPLLSLPPPPLWCGVDWHIQSRVTFSTTHCQAAGARQVRDRNNLADRTGRRMKILTGGCTHSASLNSSHTVKTRMLLHSCLHSPKWALGVRPAQEPLVTSRHAAFPLPATLEIRPPGSSKMKTWFPISWSSP